MDVIGSISLPSTFPFDYDRCIDVLHDLYGFRYLSQETHKAWGDD